MNDMSNTPMSFAPTRPLPFYRVWIKVFTKPGEHTFAEIAALPNAKASTAFLWVFLSSLIAPLVSTLRTLGWSQISQISDIDTVFMNFFLVVLLSLVSVFTMIVVLVHWSAKLFKGASTFSQLAYTVAAIYAPSVLVRFVLIGLMTPIIIPISIAGPVTLLFIIYAFALFLIAVKTVNKFGWGATTASVFLFVLILVCLYIALWLYVSRGLY